MNRIPLILLAAFSFLALLSSCTTDSEKERESETRSIVESKELAHDEHSNMLYAINASQYGMSYRETMILMQNRKGLRIEYCVDRSALEIWISPQAGKSVSYIDRNWSNRDDHTNVFDRILIPGLSLHTFDSCDWDPFHSIVYFADKTLHISQVYDRPAVLVWFEEGGEVDFKIVGEPVERSEKAFIMNHQDRDRNFQSAAVIGKGEGSFRHMLQTAPHRSVYARAELAPGQLLVIASELKKELIGNTAKEIAALEIQSILAENDRMVSEDLSDGRFSFRDQDEMQKLLEKGRRTALSMQDFEGFMRSTNQYIYYLLWYRDGGMNTGHLAYTGWTEPARMQARLALNNPNISYEDPPGRFFGMLPTGAITKWEEDGLFYVVWPAFNYWTLTGDKTYCEGEYLELMHEAMAWMEAYLWDEEKNLFFRTHYCETPYSGTRGDGFDNATGAPTYFNDSRYEETPVVGAYDIYINLLNYSVYMMLSAMEQGEMADNCLRKAKKVESGLREILEHGEILPSYGEVLTKEGETIMTKPYGMDIWDYVWALSLPPFTPTLPEEYANWREQLYEDMTTTEQGYFLCCYFALLTSMDTEIHDEDRILAAMEKLVDYSIAPGKYLPMPYAIPEMFNISEENPFHDVRPLVYSIAPWLSSVTNMGIRTFPFGVGVRSADHLEQITNFVYRQGKLDVSFHGTGDIKSWTVNGDEVHHTLQLPENLVRPGKNEVVVYLDESSDPADLLISSTLQLNKVEEKNSTVQFHVTAYGKNVLTFRNLEKTAVVTDIHGSEISQETTVFNDLTYLEFEGRGEYIIWLR